MPPPWTGDDDELTQELNDLLSYLNIPISLQSPAELTPLLLIAILKSLLDAPNSIPARLPHLTKDENDTRSMKIFLGILETDIIQMDVGLSAVDPRMLARGGWDEVVFVAKLLCWVGRKVYGGSRYKPVSPRPEYDTSLSLDSSSLLNFASPSYKPAAARCIRSVSSPSLLFSPCDDADTLCGSKSSQRSDTFSDIRYDGYIHPVDEDQEIASFERNRQSMSFLISESDSASPTDDDFDIEKALELASRHDIYLHTRTVALLEQRAQLLEELAKLENG